MGLFKTAVKAHMPLALCVVLCSTAMLGVYRAFGALEPRVLWGAALGTAGSLLNLLLLQLTLQKVQQAPDEAAAAQRMNRSASLRLLVLCAVCYFGFMLPYFSSAAVALPFFFPRGCAFLLRKAAPVWAFAREKLVPGAAPKN